ncbi:sensor histidine kinase [Actinosynnema sp. CA-299493]
MTNPQQIDFKGIDAKGQTGLGSLSQDWVPAELRARLSESQRTLNNQILLLTLGAIALISLFGGVVWLAMGWVLRPVEAIRREMADITEHDLTRRVPVPLARNEIADLAATVNATLDRLEAAAEDNRRFVADASHELRSPIAALRAELEIATIHPDLADWPAVVDAALADTERLQHLATDLLLLARLDHTPVTTGHEAIVDFTNLVSEHTSRRRSQHTLTTDLPRHPALVRGSLPLLDRLLGNLLDNAERHATSTITVRLTTIDDEAVLEVTDDGPGIPTDDHEHIFDRFTRLDHARTRDTGGTGLGLPIARRIATTHHGTLHASDHPTGARLTTAIPLDTKSLR